MLTLESNSLCDKGAGEILSALKNSTSLTSLGLCILYLIIAYNGISFRDPNMLEFLETNMSLTKLKLGTLWNLKCR